MKFTTICAILSTLDIARGAVIQKPPVADDECMVTWVTVTLDATPQSTGAASTSRISQNINTNIQKSAVASATSSSSSASSASTHATPIETSSVNATSALDLSGIRLPGGQAPIPINDDYVHAPEDNTPIPNDVAIFSPANPGEFDCTAFAIWRDQHRDNPPASKFLKIKPGSYRYKLGTKLNVGDDPNDHIGMNIVMYLMKGGWTLDLRGVTFYIDITEENKLQRPDVLIYTLQSDHLTILGGTIWSDWGEMYTQALVTAVNGDTATFQVEQGYNITRWREAGPRNQACINPSDPNHFQFGDCNFWKVDTYNFDRLDSDRTFTAHLLGGDGLAVGYVVTMMNGFNAYNSMFTLSNEANTNLHVKGMTTNGGFMCELTLIIISIIDAN